MPNQPPPQPTLYERLVGTFSIARVVDDLIDRVMFKVPAAEQTEVKAIVQSTYGDIVIGKS